MSCHISSLYNFRCNCHKLQTVTGKVTLLPNSRRHNNHKHPDGLNPGVSRWIYILSPYISSEYLSLTIFDLPGQHKYTCKSSFATLQGHHTWVSYTITKHPVHVSSDTRFIPKMIYNWPRVTNGF